MHCHRMLSRAAAKLRALARSESGASAIVLAFVAIPVVGAVGAAVDVSRAYVARSHLTSALDAAGLAVGSTTGTDAQLQTTFTNFFQKNYPDGALGAPVSTSMTVDNATGTITATGTRQVDTTFMRVLGVDTLNVSASVQIKKEQKNLEIALVLDNTGSMAQNGKIAALRSSATDLVNILFGNNTSSSALRVSLVPFVTTVNIGTGNAGVVDFTGQSFTGTSWKGCIVERPYPNNIQDTSVATGGKWKAYSWPKEPRSVSCDNPKNSSGTGWNSIDEIPSDTSGPNKSCAQPVIQLTSNKSSLLTAIGQMTPWNNGGTMTHVGLAWGLRSISPGDPFHLGAQYDDTNTKKAIVMLTDGINDLVVQPSSCSNTVGGPYTDYSGEGYPVDSHSLGTSGSTKAIEYNNVRAKMDQLTGEACTYIKSKGVTLYTVLLQVNNAATQTIYRNCASDPAKFFNVPTSTELQAVFHQIANELSNLRVSQ